MTYSIEGRRGECQVKSLDIFGESGIYIGGLVNGKPHGAGQLYFYNRNFLEGVFKEGSIEAEDAVMIESNGNYYRGGFRGSQQTGRGVLRASGAEWRGEFAAGRISGTFDGSQGWGSGSRRTGGSTWGCFRMEKWREKVNCGSPTVIPTKGTLKVARCRG